LRIGQAHLPHQLARDGIRKSAGQTRQPRGELMIQQVRTELGALVIEHAGRRYGAGEMLVFTGSGGDTVRASEPAVLMLLGGEPLGERHLWWNFVSSRKERIEQAKADWLAGRFAMPPGEEEFIPLPEDTRPSEPKP
jgi:redox-sensitive bicupin YhaK (pirin superfamily)